MDKKAVSGIMLALLFIGMLTVAFNIQPVKSEPKTIIVPDDYPTIQEAINNANDGDTIFVRAGTYHEHIIVDKPVSTIGENRSTTIIDADGIGIVVRVTANHVNISGFTIRNSCPACYGIYISSSSDISVSGNIVTKNGRGIYATDCKHIRIKENLVTENHFGISLVKSVNNVLRNNSLYANNYNLGVSGLCLSHYIQDIDVSNTADEKPIYYWINEQNRQVPSDAGYVAVVNSTSIVVRDLILSKDYQGLLFAYTNSSVIHNVTVSNNFDGICFFHSHHNNIINNTMKGNRGLGLSLTFYSSNNTVSNNWILKNRSTVFGETTDGVRLEYHAIGNKIVNNTISDNTNGIRSLLSSDNMIYHNNFINNTLREHGMLSVNIWDNDYPSGGNHWGNYDDTDLYNGPYQNETGCDWIVDSPYVIDENNQDNYPLMYPFVPENEEIRIAYRNLLLKYTEMRSCLDALNSTFYKLLGNITELQEKYDSFLTTISNMQEQINSLNSTLASGQEEIMNLQEQIDDLQEQVELMNSTLQTSISELQQQCNSLNSSLTLGQEAIINELNNTKNIISVFIATTIILMATIVYLARRKPKIKP